MPSSLSVRSRREVIQHLVPAINKRLVRRKPHLLNECVSVTGYTRKYALRLLNHPEEDRSRYRINADVILSRCGVFSITQKVPNKDQKDRRKMVHPPIGIGGEIPKPIKRSPS